jgi:hypothetical protein
MRRRAGISEYFELLLLFMPMTAAAARPEQPLLARLRSGIGLDGRPQDGIARGDRASDCQRPTPAGA